jgi:hypothetical protein
MTRSNLATACFARQAMPHANERGRPGRSPGERGNGGRSHAPRPPKSLVLCDRKRADPMRLLTTRGHRERTSVRAASGCARSLSQFPQGVVLPEVGQQERAPVADAGSQLHVSARVTAVTADRPEHRAGRRAGHPDRRGQEGRAHPPAPAHAPLAWRAQDGRADRGRGRQGARRGNRTRRLIRPGRASLGALAPAGGEHHGPFGKNQMNAERSVVSRSCPQVSGRAPARAGLCSLTSGP